MTSIFIKTNEIYVRVLTFETLQIHKEKKLKHTGCNVLDVLAEKVDFALQYKSKNYFSTLVLTMGNGELLTV